MHLKTRALRYALRELQKKGTQMTWRQHADAALTDLAAGINTTGDDRRSVGHLRDAQDNLEKAILALEEEIEKT